MFQEFERVLLEAYDFSQKSAPPPLSKLPPLPSYAAPAGTVRCACDKKNIPFTEVMFHNSKFLRGISDTMCQECYRDCRGLAMIACIKCKAVVSRLAPGRCKSGFVIEAGSVIHTNGCPKCITDVVMTFLIEKALFDHANGYPVNPEIMAGLGLHKK